MKRNLLVIVGWGLIWLKLVGSVEAVELPTLSWEPVDTASPAVTIALQSTKLPTEPLGQPAQDRLEAALEKQQVGPLSLTNFFKYAIRVAIERGVPTNTVVLVLLLPLVGTIVGALYYIVGLTGFGVFMPAMISVSFLATGIVGGLILFAIILSLTSLVRKFLRKIRLHQRARRAVTLWVVSLGTFGLLFFAPVFHLSDLTKISIFPILFMILLSEEFVRIQVGRSRKKAISLTLGTLIISIVGAMLMDWQQLQELVILHPETSFFLILFIDLFVGRYTGFRLLEYKRFKSVLRK